jgi:hypothetical protein
VSAAGWGASVTCARAVRRREQEIREIAEPAFNGHGERYATGRIASWTRLR